MKEYYRYQNVVLYHGDSRDIVPTLLTESHTFDAIVTDPVWPNCPEGLLPGSEDPYGLFSDVAQHFHHLAERVVVQLGCNSDPRFLWAIPRELPFLRQCVLEYVQPGYQGRLLYTHDVAYLFGSYPKSRKGARVLPGRYTLTDITRARTSHPAARVQGHVDWLFRFFVQGAVLDPFMGSGTTLSAALRKGVAYAGIEIEERYLEIAARHIERYRQTLFAEAET